MRGTGVDVVYPKENRKPAEASENSGTRVTARCAAEHNWDLFAVPGKVTSKGSWTPNTLIKQGAKLVATWDHVLEDRPSQVRLELEAEDSAHDRPASKHGAGASLLPDSGLRAEEARVLEALRSDESLQIERFWSFWRRNLPPQKYLRRFLSRR